MRPEVSVSRAKGRVSTVLAQDTDFGDNQKFPFLPAYLQAMVGVAKTKLPTGHHGLQCSPVIPTDEAPA